MKTSSATDGVDDHGGRVVEELRLLLDALLGSSMGDMQAWAQRWSAQSEAEQHAPTTCGWCPVCAAIAMVRGERPELAVRLAERVAGLIHVLRDVVEHHDAPRHRHDASNGDGRDHNFADHDGHGVDGHRVDGHRVDGHRVDGHGVDGHSGDRHRVDGHQGDGHSPAAAAEEPGGGSGSERPAEELMRIPSRVQRISLRRPEGCLSGPSMVSEGCLSGPSMVSEGCLSGPSVGPEGCLSGEVTEAGGGEPMC